MLNPFPDFLIFGFFAPTILRITVALVLFYIAYRQYQNSERIAQLEIALLGKNFAPFAIAYHVFVGLMLFFGAYTQVGALLAIAGFVKGLWLNKRYPNVAFLPNSTIYVLIVVSVALLFTGAGALAFDIPL